MRRESTILLLTTATIVIATAWVAISMIFLYQTALGQVRTNMVEMVQSQARLVEAVALFDTLSSDEASEGDAFAAKLGRIIDSHNRNGGFGETGEYRLAQIRGDSIVFLLDHAGHGRFNADPIHIKDELAEPMRLALRGNSTGTTIDLDYRGIKVLAAYAAIRELHLGVVAKIDLAEIRRPYIKAGMILSALILFMIGVGTVLFRRNGSPLVRQAEEGEDFRVIADTAMDAIISIDQNSVIIYVNPSICEIFGYSLTEMLGQPLEMLIPSDLKEKHRNAFSQFIRTGKKTISWDKFELLGQHKSGRQFPIEMSLGTRIQPDGSKVVTGFLQDITVRAELEEMWRRYETIINNSLIQQSFINRQYVYEAVNDAYCKAKRLKREDIIGKTVSEIWGAKTFKNTLESHLDRCFQGEEVHYEAKFQYNDEEERWFSVYYFPYSDSTGMVTNAIVMSEDVTARKQAEEALKSSEAQLRQLQKIEAVGQLAGGVAHDFNNLLQVIQGYTQMAFEVTEPGDAIHQHLLESMQAVDKAGTLIRQLLAFSRRQVLELETLNLNEVVLSLSKMIHRVIGEHIEVEIISQPDLNTIRADKGQMEQILMNLCINARDAMPEGGKITIETVNKELDQEYCRANSWAKPGRYVVLVITDSGCGMDKETQNRVFEPFFTTKEEGKGTGLGLSTVYGIVYQHEGLINIYSKLGKGTVFKIYFPVVDTVEKAQDIDLITIPRGGTETILFAEDDEAVRNLAIQYLVGNGYKVFVAKDGEEAIHLYDKHVDEIDLVLLDVVMPKGGGKAVFNHINKKQPHPPVLFSSGYSMNVLSRNFVLDKGKHLIEKPYHRDALLRKIRELLDT